MRQREGRPSLCGVLHARACWAPSEWKPDQSVFVDDGEMAHESIFTASTRTSRHAPCPPTRVLPRARRGSGIFRWQHQCVGSLTTCCADGLPWRWTRRRAPRLRPAVAASEVQLLARQPALAPRWYLLLPHEDSRSLCLSRANHDAAGKPARLSACAPPTLPNMDAVSRRDGIARQASPNDRASSSASCLTILFCQATHCAVTRVEERGCVPRRVGVLDAS